MHHCIFHSLPVTGPCRAAFPRWYYNIDSHKCEQFIYGGCNGTKNNFDTKAECEGSCTTNTGKQGWYSLVLHIFNSERDVLYEEKNPDFLFVGQKMDEFFSPLY